MSGLLCPIFTQMKIGENEDERLRGLAEYRAFDTISEPDLDRLTRIAQTLQLTLDASQIGVWRIDIKTGEVDWDAQMFDLVGLARNSNAPAGRHLLHFVHPNDRGWMQKQLGELREGLPQTKGEIRLLLPNHEVRHVETRMFLTYDPDGTPAWIVGANRDITERKANEDALKVSLREINDLKTALDEHAIVAVTNARGRIIRVNDRFCAISGYSRAELIGADHRMINSGKHPTSFFAAVWQTITHGEVWHGEICNRSKLGKLYWVETTIVPFFGDDGKPVQYIAIRADITARKEAEERRLRSEEQLTHERKLETLGNFAGGIAHDFNNLIAGIGGHVELALMDLCPDSPVAALLRNAEIGCTRAAELAKRLLLFARRGAAQPPAALDLGKLVRETVPILRPTLGLAVSLKVEVEPDLPPALGDECQLMQVLMNLCVNGAHAMGHDGGRLIVSVGRSELLPTDRAAFPDAVPGEHLALRVSDTGSGMDTATQAQMFEPFFTTKSPDQGTGLGLSVVHGIVCQHQGAIRVHSRLHHGTTIEILLPFAPSAISPAATGKPQERILVVDDEPAALSTLVELLRFRGYSADGYENPTRALDALRSRTDRFDILITDQTMPEMTGLALAAEARKRCPTLRVIMVSGHLTPILVQEANMCGVTAQLAKPLEAETLFPTIRRLMMASTA